MRFLGIDLAWSAGGTGLCCLEWRDGTLMALDLRRVDSHAASLAWVDIWVPAGVAAGVAVDAPTLIPNATGMRLCDRLAHKYFGRYHAGCYPANLGLPFANHTVGFGLSLEARGFHHAPTLTPQREGRFQIEVFPHPATVRLFGLSQILKYKKGKVADRRVALTQLRQLICDRLPLLTPPLDWRHSPIAVPAVPLRGAALKALEDQLDSIICAYMAAHWWYWGTARNEVLGDRANGYIVVPKPPESNDRTGSLDQA